MEHNFVTVQLPSRESLLVLVAWPVSRLRRILVDLTAYLDLCRWLPWSLGQSLDCVESPPTWQLISPRRNKSFSRIMFLPLNKTTSCIKRLHRSTDLKGSAHYSTATSLYPFFSRSLTLKTSLVSQLFLFLSTFNSQPKIMHIKTPIYCVC